MPLKPPPAEQRKPKPFDEEAYRKERDAAAARMIEASIMRRRYGARNPPRADGDGNYRPFRFRR